MGFVAELTDAQIDAANERGRIAQHTEHHEADIVRASSDLKARCLPRTAMLKRLSQRLHQLRERLAFRYMPQVAEWAVWAASVKSIPELQKRRPVKLLVDSTIRAHAITHESAWIDTGTKLWGGVHPVKTGYAARIPVHSSGNKTPEYSDICRLTVIASLARKGLFELCTSSELMAEQDRQPPARFRATGYSDHSLLDGLKIESVDGWNFDALTRRVTDLKEAQRTRLRSSDDSLYQAIRIILGHEKHSQDAWHIRTAERYGMYAFLTMDYSLVRLVRAQKTKLASLGLSTRVLTPTEIADDFGLREVPPHLFNYTNASFPVRPDVCWPDERRRRTGRKSKE